MNKRIIVFVLTMMLLAFAGAFAKGKSAHPEAMGSQDCLECHADVTPEIVDQWEHSAHGFIGVKCQVCHGDEKDFKKVPTNDTCQGCHDLQVENNRAPKTACAACHKAHTFTVHKMHQYNPTDVK